MPHYHYTAKSQPTKTVDGVIEAESENDCLNKLVRMGYYPISVQAEALPPAGSQSSMRFGRISKTDIVLFTRQLSSLIDSGVNIITGLNIISTQTTNKHLRLIIEDVFSRIKDGRSLSDSLGQHPAVFSSLYVSIIRSGEAGGTLEKSLSRLADFLEKQEEFRQSLRAALAYPLFVLGVGVLTVYVLLSFVIPKLVVMFEDMGTALPLPTKILISISSFLQNFWWLVIAFVILIAFTFKRSYQKTENKLFWDGLKLKTVVWGPLTLKSEISRVMRTLSLLVSSGITIVASLDVAVSVSENQLIKNELKKFKDQINNGLNFSRCLNDSKLFPPFVTNIVTVGEETGTLERAMMRIADDYERDVDRSLKALSRLMEPVIILVVGVIVGFIVLSMLLPIFQLNLIVS